MSDARKIRLVYILPDYDPAISSHFSHLYGFLGAAARELDLFLLVEKAKAKPSGIEIACYCQKFSWPPLRMAELFFVLIRERLRGRKYFYTRYSFLGAFAAWCVTKMLGGASFYWNCGMAWLYARSWPEEALFRFILRHAILVTGTVRLGKMYQERYGLRDGRVRIVPNSIEVERFSHLDKTVARRRLGLPPLSPVVLFVHRLSRRKGAHLLPAISAVSKLVKDVIFVIVGDGPEMENLKREIAGRGLPLVLTGAVPNRDLNDYFAAADVFLMPSEEEGFPHSLLEAMAAGLPYVASDVGGVREITPPELARHLVPSGDIAAFQQGVSAMLALDKTGRAAISAIARAWVRRYDISAVLPQFAALFCGRGLSGEHQP